MDEMTDEQKAFCVQTAQWIERVKTFPGGTKFLVDLFEQIATSVNLTLVDADDPKISLRREITQELYDALWTARELRKSGYTLATAKTLGLDDLYRMHGVMSLTRFVDISTSNALHNAGLEGFSRSASTLTSPKSTP